MIDPQDLAFTKPYSVILTGPSGSGKSCVALQIARQTHGVYCDAKKRGKIFLFYKENQPLYYEFEKLGAEFIHGEQLNKLDKIIDNKEERDKLIIFDDLPNLINSEQLVKLFTIYRHHRNISIIFIAHSLFNKKSENFRLISLNTQYILIFKSPRNIDGVATLSRQMGLGKFMQYAYKDATCNPYSYLLIDMRQETPDNIRLRSNIFELFPNVYAESI